MAYITVNSDGFLNNVESFVDECTQTYKTYLLELLQAKRVEDLSMNEMAFIRLVSSSSILSMKKSGNTMLEILRKPVNKPSIAASKPITEDAVRAFMAKLSPEKRKELFGF